ncbi:HAD hydrolase-like protein [Streptomyces capparidis]
MRTRPGSSAGALCEEYDTALLDLDGVVYRGPVAIDHAAEALREARARRMRLAYVTNNASRPPEAVAGNLTGLGVPARAEEVITSAQAVARLVADEVAPGAPVLAVGGEGLVRALEERGLRPVASADDEPVAVVMGFDPSVGWERLAEASFAVGRGVPFFASNTDLTIPTPRGIAPGNGALVQVVRTATGVAPRVAGKPLPPMHRETILRTGAERPLVVGDRLDTDIEGAHAGGVDSLLVLTGVTTAAQLLAAPPEHRPTYVAADLRGLLVPHPAVEDAGDGFRCGGWTASARDGALEVAGEGDALDGLRALCAAAWSAAERPAAEGAEGEGEPLEAGKALEALGL